MQPQSETSIAQHATMTEMPMRVIWVALLGVAIGSLMACGGGGGGSNTVAASTAADTGGSTGSQSSASGATTSGSGSTTGSGSTSGGSTGTGGTGSGGTGSTGSTGSGSTGGSGGTGTGGTGGTGSGGTGSGGSGGSTPNNVVSAAVDCGPSSICSGDAPDNYLFVTVTVCIHGTTTCQSIDHVQVDTGSSGLRILASALTSVSLPAEVDTSGNTVAECTQLGNSQYANGGYTFGEVATADVQIGGETASNVPVQIIGSAATSAYSTPSDCAGSGGTALDTPQSLLANGVLGVSPFAQDCGTSCSGHAGTVIASMYYGCSTTSPCQDESVPVAQQLTNPVTMFPQDNNGLIIELPSIAPASGQPDAGEPSVTGQIVFGIGTESNNAITTQTVVPADPTLGTVVTSYDSQTLSASYFDTGANAYFFGASSETSIPQCTTDTGYYCPTSELALTATVSGATTNSATSAATPAAVSFSIGDADTLNQSGADTAFDNLGGLLPAAYSQDASSLFIWGLPFFYGRNVYIAFAGENTTAGTGPYYAF